MSRPAHPALRFGLQTLLLVMLALVVALGGGLGSAWLAAGRFDAHPSGGIWHPLPDRETLRANPYRRDPAGESFPLDGNGGAKHLFVADRSVDGAPLRRNCDYRVSGRMPPSRFWTLSALDETFAPLRSDQAGLTSLSVVWQADGSLAITVGAEPAPGNWIRLEPGMGGLLLLAGLYDTPSSEGGVAGDPDLPVVTRLGCADDPS